MDCSPYGIPVAIFASVSRSTRAKVASVEGGANARSVRVPVDPVRPCAKGEREKEEAMDRQPEREGLGGNWEREREGEGEGERRTSRVFGMAVVRVEEVSSHHGQKQRVATHTHIRGLGLKVRASEREREREEREGERPGGRGERRRKERTKG